MYDTLSHDQLIHSCFMNSRFRFLCKEIKTKLFRVLVTVRLTVKVKTLPILLGCRIKERLYRLVEKMKCLDNIQSLNRSMCCGHVGTSN